MSKGILGIGLAALLVLPAMAGATLINRGGGLIYDDVLNITLLQDANLAATNTFGVSGITTNGAMTWNTATGTGGWIAGMNTANYLGFSDWRLPNADVNNNSSIVNCTGSGVAGCSDNELGYLFWEEGITSAAPGPFTNVQLGYWSGTELLGDPNSAWFFTFGNFFSGGQGTSLKSGISFAWAVRSGDVVASSVPEPGTLVLLGIGLAGIGLGKQSKRRL